MEADHANWPLARDHALVLYVDTLCRAWSTTPSRLMPDELLLSEVDLTSEDFHLLQGELTDLFDSSLAVARKQVAKFHMVWHAHSLCSIVVSLQFILQYI